jgi:uncharacterized membrane protein
MLGARSARLVVIASAIAIALAGAARAQESGGSFGGSAWDDEPSSPSGGGASTDYGGSGSVASPQDDWATRQADEERERQAAAERERAAAEAARVAAEAEAARIAAEAAERARRLALPPADRVAALSWPASPAFPSVSSPSVIEPDRPIGERASRASWVSPQQAPAQFAPAHEVRGSWNALGAIPCGGVSTLVLLGAALLLTRLTTLAPRRAGAGSRTVAAAGPAMRVSIAFDWTARAQLQSALASMASRFDMRTRPGLTEASRAIATLLDQHASAARYVSWELSTGDARSWFQNRTNDLRARFRAELVRNDAVTQSPAFRAREDEGQGLVVVTVVVAGKTPIRPPSAAFDLPSLRAAIAAIADHPAGQTLALEVIWSPAAENDRMSSYELEKLYPELQRISEGVGARQCPYCRGPFPAELGKCPSCGAPS